DYGATWTKIVNGIPAGSYVHAVREDPTRAGLLYAGTEHGIYISFDDGDDWRPLSLNLPDVQVSDIAVERNDLVIATHGRSMYVLDDIGPLRQFNSQVASAQVHLFAPHDAIRGVSDATIQYALAQPADSVTIQILDASGRVIRTMTGGQRDSAASDSGSPPGTPKGCETSRRGRQSRPDGKRGLNRFTWDLRYAGAVTFPCLIMWGASPGRGPLAVPGTYRVRVTANGMTQTAPLTVRLNPALEGVTRADLQEQFALAIKIRDRVSDADRAVLRIRDVRSQVQDRLGRTHNRRITTAGQSLVERLTAAEDSLYQTRNRSGEDPLNFPIKINNRMAALGNSVERGDNRPTGAAYVVFKQLSATLDAQLQALNGLFDSGVGRFNRLLTAEHLEPVRAAPLTLTP
ncbi:MAG TPA: FlgD immunoglobulin-like domain containing protein, partial [Gemmatimonadaceae bacterium]|nr:FlgD immunoglobulin-like domain containing protein [Gemmatimonadaceae bacterium]